MFQVSLHPQEQLQCLRQAPEERQQAGLTQHQIEGETVPSLVRQLCSMVPRFLLSRLAVDRDNRVYVLSTQLRVVRLERHGNTYTQSPYAPPFPDLPVCTSGGPVPCSPTLVDFPPFPNEMAFDDDGFLYVTDSLQATIYRIPLVNAPEPDDIELVHTFPGFVVPDSLTFGHNGTLYVSLAGRNEIAVLDTDGQESRISGPTGSAIPFDAPATMAFDHTKKSLLIANHAIFGDPAHFAVLRVFVADPGNPLPGPSIP